MITPLSSSSLVGLRCAVAELREEHTALRDCLASMGLLSTEKLLSELHRRRFAAALRAYPCAWHMSLPHALEMNELIGLTTMRFAGLPTAASITAASRGVAHSMQVVAGSLKDACTRLYVCGGADGHQALSSAECFDPMAGAWQDLPATMALPRAAAAAAVMAGRLYVCGGITAQRAISSVERLDTTAGAWETLAPLSQPRADAVAGVVAGRLSVCGGCHGSRVLSSAERLDPVAGSWEAFRPLLHPRAEAAAAVVAGRFYVCGGTAAVVAGGQEPLSSAERFDPAVGAWEPMTPLSQPRYAAAAALVGGYLYVVGGHNGREFLASAERLDPVIRAWEATAPLAQPRAGLAAAVIVGRLYVCGGHDGQRALRVAERYDPATLLWESVAPLSQSRASAVAAAILA